MLSNSKNSPAELTFIKKIKVNDSTDKLNSYEYIGLLVYYEENYGTLVELPFKSSIPITPELKLDVDYDTFCVDNIYRTIEFQLPKLVDKETFRKIKNFGIRKLPIVKKIGF
jgi:hypothetical protein